MEGISVHQNVSAHLSGFIVSPTPEGLAAITTLLTEYMTYRTTVAAVRVEVGTGKQSAVTESEASKHCRNVNRALGLDEFGRAIARRSETAKPTRS